MRSNPRLTLTYSRGSSPRSELWHRLAAAGFYIFLGLTLRTPSDGNLQLLLLLAILYWVFVQRSRLSVPYFLRFHLLQGLLLAIIFGLGTIILLSAFEVLFSVFRTMGLDALIHTFRAYYLDFTPYIIAWTILGTFIFMGSTALLGHMLEFPGIGSQVRRWA